MRDQLLQQSQYPQRVSVITDALDDPLALARELKRDGRDLLITPDTLGRLWLVLGSPDESVTRYFVRCICGTWSPEYLLPQDAQVHHCDLCDARRVRSRHTAQLLSALKSLRPSR